jgi:hypothetical protein
MNVALYVALAPADAEVVLDEEHDELRWLPLADAEALCLPAEVGACLTSAAAWLDARRSGPGASPWADPT